MADINGMRTGFVLDKDGNRILPITHMSLIIGNDGQTIMQAVDEVKAKADQATNAVSEMSQTISSYDQQIADANAMISEVDNKVTHVDNRIATVNTFEELPINDALTDGAIRYVINDKKYYSYTALEGWQEMVTSGEGGGYVDDTYSHIWIGTEPPEDSNMIWVDTNTDGVVESEDDMSLLRIALEKITEMQNEISSLKRRVKYLEEHGTFDPDAPGDETPDDSDDIILLEDGTPLGLEDGSGDILMEIQTEKPSEEEVNAVLLEDGTCLLYEDGSKILLEM